MDTHNSICPIVQRETLQLFERVEVAGEYRFLPFSAEILWLRESQTQIVLRHRGVTVDERSCLCDHYGYLKSLESAIKETAQVAKAFKVKPGDVLSVECDLEITEIPVIAKKPGRNALQSARNAYRNEYQCVPNSGKLWYTSDKPQPHPDPAWQVYPRLDSIVYLKQEGIFTTEKHQVGKIPPEVAAFIKSEREKAGTDGTLVETEAEA